MEKAKEIESILMNIYLNIGMDKPENHEDILKFVINDVNETADPENWHSGDVVIALRRWIENKKTSADDYFQIVQTGYNKDLEREEFQIHGGENANIIIIKTEEGFIIDVYGQQALINSMTVWDDDLINEDDEE